MPDVQRRMVIPEKAQGGYPSMGPINKGGGSGGPTKSSLTPPSKQVVSHKRVPKGTGPYFRSKGGQTPR